MNFRLLRKRLRWGYLRMKIDMILLAAGNSRRFGSNKLFYEVNGTALYRLAFDRLLTAAREGENRIFVVSRYAEILSAAKAYSPLMTPVPSPDSELGISRSIRNGIAASGGSADALAFFVADQPWLKPGTIREFLDQYAKSGMPLGSLRFADQMGNPAIFSRTYFPELLALSGDKGGRKILNAHPEECFYFSPDSAQELIDLDIPPDEDMQ